MRLADLEPNWFVAGGNPHPVGFSFNCPCPKCRGEGSKLAIAVHLDGTNFDPDPANPQQFMTNEFVWSVAGGESFENISLTPSVDASKHGHWHGHITNGQIVGGI